MTVETSYSVNLIDALRVTFTCRECQSEVSYAAVKWRENPPMHCPNCQQPWLIDVPKESGVFNLVENLLDALKKWPLVSGNLKFGISLTFRKQDHD